MNRTTAVSLPGTTRLATPRAAERPASAALKPKETPALATRISRDTTVTAAFTAFPVARSHRPPANSATRPPGSRRITARRSSTGSAESIALITPFPFSVYSEGSVSFSPSETGDSSCSSCRGGSVSLRWSFPASRIFSRDDTGASSDPLGRLGLRIGLCRFKVPSLVYPVGVLCVNNLLICGCSKKKKGNMPRPKMVRAQKKFSATRQCQISSSEPLFQESATASLKDSRRKMLRLKAKTKRLYCSNAFMRPPRCMSSLWVSCAGPGAAVLRFRYGKLWGSKRKQTAQTSTSW
mmetsp:Transcript_50720/g.110653  ORF Transcript_50720/g.110653 Transcript_50720/m.110653 type:complete len:294 (-) Transcript_50720:71-952(-)